MIIEWQVLENLKIFFSKVFISFLFLVIYVLSYSCSRHYKSIVVDEDSVATHVWGEYDSLRILSEIYDEPIIAIRRLNKIYDENDLSVGKVIKIPQTQLPSTDKINNTQSVRKGEGALSNKNLDNEVAAQDFVINNQASHLINNEKFLWPVQGKISSGFGHRWGKMHQGIDIPAVMGVPIKAAASGKVVRTRYIAGYGLTIEINHGNNFSTLYSHCSKLNKNVGDIVKQGEIIALVGNTGRSSGNHLHFELRISQKPVDPLPYLENVDGINFAADNKK